MNNAKRDADIVRRARAGETYQSIGDSYALTRGRVGQITTKAGIVRARSARLTETETSVIVRRANHGDAYRDIGASLGRPTSTVQSAALRSGIRRHASKVQAGAFREIALEGRIAGLSAQEISNRTGMTRNAVIGYWCRLRKKGRL